MLESLAMLPLMLVNDLWWYLFLLSNCVLCKRWYFTNCQWMTTKHIWIFHLERYVCRCLHIAEGYHFKPKPSFYTFLEVLSRRRQVQGQVGWHGKQETWWLPGHKQGSSRAYFNKQTNIEKKNFKERASINDGKLVQSELLCRLRHLSRFIYDG